MTLTEFLLARIAEDEGRASRWHINPALTPGPDRVLAECEAKRRIVEDCVHLATSSRRALHAHSEWVLEQMARVYVDHPDYDESWRP